MNRIILIGNGFDIAHGLKTGYRDFINNYWRQVAFDKQKSKKKVFDDNFIEFDFDNFSFYDEKELLEKISSYISFKETYGFSENTRINSLDDIRKSPLVFKNKFFERITKKSSLENWGGIEIEYYKCLSEIARGKSEKGYGVKQLNNEFEEVEKALRIYLTDIEKNATPKIFEQIKKSVYSPFHTEDISIKYMDEYEKYITQKVINISLSDQIPAPSYYLKETLFNWREDIEDLIDDYKKQKDQEKFISNLVHGKMPKHDGARCYLALPGSILIVNFNYTKTAERYKPDHGDFKVINIHGKLKDDEYPIIFGYGDELADDYKELENLHDGEFLKNVKSMRYLETDSYRKVMEFIESEPYQIFTMGHSCGVSDRTLLNTMFEHENCLSIKPFFYVRENGTNDYAELVQNISRNFKNKPAMRDIVVHKMNCIEMTK